MSDVYRVGVVLALSSTGLPLLGTLAAGLTKIGHDADHASSRLTALKLAATGAMGVIAGAGTLRAMVGLVRAGSELNTEFTRTVMLGGEIAANADRMRTDALAWAQQIPSWNPAQLLSLDRELATQVGVGEARELVPMLARLGTNIQFATGGRDGGEHAVVQAYRTVEAVGGGFSVGEDGQRHFDPARFERFMNSLQASILASGGMVSINDMLQATRQGGPSLRGMSPEVLFPYLAEAGIQMGAARAGTANMSWAQQFAGGIMTRRAAEGLQGAGLLHEGEWHARRGGAIVVADEARRRLADALRDPPAWVRDVLMPRMAGQDNATVMAAMMAMFGRQTTMRLIADLEQNNPQFFRMRQNAANVPGVNQNFDTLNRTSVAQNMTNFTQAWHGLEQALSDAMTGPSIGVLHTLTDAIHRITQWATVNPDVVEQIGVGLGILAASLALMGAGTLAGAALTMLAGPAGLVAFAAGLGAIAYAYRDDLPGLMNRAGEGLGRWGEVMSRGWDRMLEALPRGWARFTALMSRGWDRMTEALPRGLERVGGLIEAGWVRMFGSLPQNLERLSAQLADAGARLGDKIRVALLAAWDGVGDSHLTVPAWLTRLSEEVMHQLYESVMRDVNRLVELVGPGLRRITTAILSWIDGLASLPGQVLAALGKITSAILEWVGGLAGRVGAALLQSNPPPNSLPPGQNAPSGVPGPGPTFGPQRLGDPSQAPGKHSWLPPAKDVHLASVTNVYLDGRQIAANVESRMVRGGPSGGSTGFDPRTGYYGGMAVA